MVPKNHEMKYLEYHSNPLAEIKAKMMARKMSVNCSIYLGLKISSKLYIPSEICVEDSKSTMY